MNASYKTAIRRKRLSAPLRLLKDRGCIRGSVLDFGCGLGYDADFEGYDKYDPHYFPEKLTKKYDTILCTYVLNVLPKEDESEVLNELCSLLTDGGTAYVTVRRDIKREGLTSRGTYQRRVDLKDFPVFEEKSGKFIIYRIAR